MLALNPEFEDIKKLDLDSLLDLLVMHTEMYTSLIRKEGFSTKSNVFKRTIIRLQAAIELKNA